MTDEKYEELLKSPDYKPWLDPCLPYSYLWWAKVPVEEGIARWKALFDVEETVKIGDGVAASVVIPVYNAAPYLPQLLISLAAQTLENIEIICVDDGSSDDSRAICEAFAARDPRFKVLPQPNQGAAVARNNGLEASSGKWVFFSDADDFCRPEMLAEMVAEGEKGADVVVAARHYLDFQGRTKGVEKDIPKEYFELGETVTADTEGFNAFAGLGYAAWNKLYLREYLMEQNLRFYKLPACNDMTFVTCSLLRAKRIRFIQKTYYYYRDDNPCGLVGGLDRYPTIFLEAWTAVWREVSTRSERLQAQFYDAAIRTSFWHLTHKKSVEGMKAVYQALSDGALTAMKGEKVDDDALNIGLVRDAYEALKRREPLESVLLALFLSRRNKLDAVRNDFRRTKQKVVALKEKNAALKEKNAALKEKNAALKGKNDALKGKNANLKEKNEKLKAKIVGLENSFAYKTGMFITWPLRKLRHKR